MSHFFVDIYTHFLRLRIKRIFVVGSENGQDINPALKSEILQFNDILQGEFEDKYRHLGHKLQLVMHFLKTCCKNVQLFTLADDDAVLVPWNYFPLVLNLPKLYK